MGDTDISISFNIRKPRLYRNLNWNLISGEHNALASRELMRDMMDMGNRGYRYPLDLYESVTIFQYLIGLERHRGITSKREIELKKSEDQLESTLNRTITWTFNEPNPSYKHKLGFGSWLFGEPIQETPGMTIPRLDPDIHPEKNPRTIRYGMTFTETGYVTFDRFEREMIKPYYSQII